jgi:hypothetical protein
MKIFAHALAVLCVATTACPAPADISSVDGLAGGELSSSLAVPSLTVAGDATAEAINSTSLSAATATLDALDVTTVTATSIDVDAVTTDTLSVAQQTTLTTVAATDVASDSVSTTALTAATAAVQSLATPPSTGAPASPLFGPVVGATAILGGGYDSISSDCNGRFQGSHACSEAEVLHFLRAPAFLPRLDDLDVESLDGASFFTATRAVVGFDDQSRPIIANDCGSWLSITIPGSPPELNARHILTFEQPSLPRIETTNDCSQGPDLKILCCAGAP